MEWRHSQFRAICADIKEVKTRISKGWAKQEGGSIPPARQRHIAHKAGHKGGNCDNGVDCSPLILPAVPNKYPPASIILAPQKNALRGPRACGRRRD